MAIPFYILGVYNMANGLKRIAEILPEVWKDLEELNKRFDERERANESATVLRPGDDGTGTAPTKTTTGEKDEL
jgi:hypothetical protein